MIYEHTIEHAHHIKLGRVIKKLKQSLPLWLSSRKRFKKHWAFVSRNRHRGFRSYGKDGLVVGEILRVNGDIIICICTPSVQIEDKLAPSYIVRTQEMEYVLNTLV